MFMVFKISNGLPSIRKFNIGHYATSFDIISLDTSLWTCLGIEKFGVLYIGPWTTDLTPPQLS